MIERQDTTKDFVWNNWNEITIKKDNSIFFEWEKDGKKDFGSIFYCFDQVDVSSIEELNFNNLKGCKNEPLKNKFLVISTSKDLTSDNSGEISKKHFSEWHTNQPTILINVEMNNGSKIDSHHVKVLKIFHKEYKPTQNSTT